MAKNAFGSWTRKIGKAIKTESIKIEKPKNYVGATSNKARAIEAIRNGTCLSLTYDDLPRIVEVHTIGLTRIERPAMSVFQVDGQSNDGPELGWRLMCFDECFNVSLSDRPSAAPRADHCRGAQTFKWIDLEV